MGFVSIMYTFAVLQSTFLNILLHNQKLKIFSKYGEAIIRDARIHYLGLNFDNSSYGDKINPLPTYHIWEKGKAQPNWL